MSYCPIRNDGENNSFTPDANSATCCLPGKPFCRSVLMIQSILQEERGELEHRTQADRINLWRGQPAAVPASRCGCSVRGELRVCCCSPSGPRAGPSLRPAPPRPGSGWVSAETPGPIWQNPHPPARLGLRQCRNTQTLWGSHPRPPLPPAAPPGPGTRGRCWVAAAWGGRVVLAPGLGISATFLFYILNFCDIPSPGGASGSRPVSSLIVL